MPSVLIVDDDRALAGMVASLLGTEGYDLLTAYDGETALRRHADELPHLVILDRRLPKLSGDDVCKRVRATAQTPILMLTGEQGQRKAMLSGGWRDERDPDTEWLKAHLARLRSKLESAGAPIPANVRGVGYKLG